MILFPETGEKADLKQQSQISLPDTISKFPSTWLHAHANSMNKTLQIFKYSVLLIRPKNDFTVFSVNFPSDSLIRNTLGVEGLHDHSLGSLNHRSGQGHAPGILLLVERHIRILLQQLSENTIPVVVRVIAKGIVSTVQLQFWGSIVRTRRNPLFARLDVVSERGGKGPGIISELGPTGVLGGSFFRRSGGLRSVEGQTSR